MNRIALFIFLIFIVRFRVQAQTDTTNFNSLNQALKTVWGGINPTQINTGILINKYGVLGSNTIYQNGVQSDSSTNYPNWLGALIGLRYGAIDTIYSLPNLSEITETVNSENNQKGTISLGLLDFDYNYLTDSSFLKNEISIENGIEIKSPIGGMPFKTRRLFSVCPLSLINKNRELSLTLNSNFVYSNRSTNFIKLEYSFDNFNYYELFMDIPFSISINDSSQVTIRFRFIDENNDTSFCRSSINNDLTINNTTSNWPSCGNLHQMDEGPERIWYFNNLDNYDNLIGKSVASAHYAVWHGCPIYDTNGEGRPSKPILFLAGFNPKNSKTLKCYTTDFGFNQNSPQNSVNILGQTIWRGSYYETYDGAKWPDPEGQNVDWSEKMQPNETHFLRKLRELGYDIWIMIPDDGTDLAQNTACVITKMVNLINQRYINRELTVISYSAGSWGARYALSMMERYNKINPTNELWQALHPHPKTRLWISFEGEFYGANTPIGMQHFVEKGSSTIPASIAGIFNFITLSQVNSIINTPGAQQLSKFTIPSGTGTNSQSQLLNDNLIAQNPSSRGYPDWSRKISISQGSGVGIQTENPTLYQNRFFPGQIMFNLHESPQLLPFSGPITNFRNLRSYWNNNQTSLIFSGEWGIQISFLGIPLYAINFNTWDVSGNFKGWDYCPGGTQAAANTTYDNLLNPWQSNPASYFNYTHTLHSFSPTVGSFDLRTPESNYTQEEDVFCNIDSKYNLFQIRKNINNLPVNSNARRFGFPHIADPINHRRLTPFDGVYSIGIKSQYINPPKLTNQYHVDNFEGEYLEYMLEEIEPKTYYIQNRNFGNETRGYRARIDAQEQIYVGKNVYQKYAQWWMDEEGDVVIDDNSKIELYAKEIIFTTGVSVTNGAMLYAKIATILPCNNPELYQRTSSSDNQENLQNIYINKSEIYNNANNDNKNLVVFPNPIQKNDLSFDVNLNYNGKLFIYEGLGKELHSCNVKSGTNQIEVKSCGTKGIYLLKIIDNEGNFQNQKLVFN